MALRWEPTHVTKPNPRVVPLQGRSRGLVQALESRVRDPLTDSDNEEQKGLVEGSE